MSKILGQIKNSEKGKLKGAVDEIFKTKDKYGYEEFARLFEHGFDASRNLDAIIETSLNEEQLSRMMEDDIKKHMAPIEED